MASSVRLLSTTLLMTAIGFGFQRKQSGQVQFDHWRGYETDRARHLAVARGASVRREYFFATDFWQRGKPIRHSGGDAPGQRQQPRHLFGAAANGFTSVDDGRIAGSRRQNPAATNKVPSPRKWWMWPMPVGVSVEGELGLPWLSLETAGRG